VLILLQQLKIARTAIEAIFSVCLYLLQQSVCFCFDSVKTQIYTAQSGASEIVACCFGAVWEADVDDFVEAAKQRRIAGKTLEDNMEIEYQNNR
jgi:hypothetical protein